MNNLVGAMLGVALAGLLSMGCGGAHAVQKEPSNALAIERDVSAFYASWHQSLAQGDAGGYAGRFASGGLWLFTGPDQAAIGLSAIATAAGKAASAASAVKVDPAALVVGVSAEGTAAWLSESELEGSRQGTLRNTTLVQRDGSSWRALFAHYSRGLPSEIARRNEEAGSWPPLADLGEGVDGDAEALAQLLSTALGSPEEFAALISKRPGTVAFGPAPGDRFTGTHEVSEFVRSLFAREGARLLRSGGLRAGLAAGGEVGWTATNVDLVVTKGSHDYTRPCRLTLVFAREGDGWAIVQMHLSHASPATSGPAARAE